MTTNSGAVSYRGQSSDSVRQHNLTTVLRLVHLNRKILRSQLTAITGLNRSTVLALISELEELGLVVESESQGSSGVGRPSLMVAPNENVVAFSVNPEIDATTISVVTLSGQVIDRRRKLMGHTPLRRTRSAFRPKSYLKCERLFAPEPKLPGSAFQFQVR